MLAGLNRIANMFYYLLIICLEIQINLALAQKMLDVYSQKLTTNYEQKYKFVKDIIDSILQIT